MSNNNQFFSKDYSFEILSNISIFHSYLQFGESNISRELDLLHEAYKNRPVLPYRLLKEDPEKIIEEQERLHNDHYEEWHIMAVEIGSRFRQSVIIQLYSFMEAHLFKQCELHAIKFSKEYSVNDLKGNSDLDKIAAYLNKSAGLDIKKIHQWQFISMLKNLRNVLVHREGQINDKATFDKIKVLAQNNFELNKGNGEYDFKISLNKRDFVNRCIEEVRNFLFEVIII